MVFILFYFIEVKATLLSIKHWYNLKQMVIFWSQTFLKIQELFDEIHAMDEEGMKILLNLHQY
jgi:hypothetical protein